MCFDGVSLDSISRSLPGNKVGRRIVFFPEVGSTHEVARQQGEGGVEEGTVYLAEAQTAGRGRQGRTWVSPPCSGLLFSVVLRPPLTPPQTTPIPLVASVAVAEAVRETTSLSAEIKWPNDITLGGKKVAGILSDLSARGDTVKYVVLSVGINVNTDMAQLPDEIRGMATSLAGEAGKCVSRVELLGSLLQKLDAAYQEFVAGGFAPLRERWKLLTNTLGKPVRITSGGAVLDGRAVDVDLDGALILEQPGGGRVRITAGDVSLRGAQGYA
ncbi:MAG: biotin--[acetyl-CoA-carboxylase] ligase [Chloroflexota bacterium]